MTADSVLAVMKRRAQSERSLEVRPNPFDFKELPVGEGQIGEGERDSPESRAPHTYRIYRILRPLDEKTQRRRGQSVVSIVAGPHFGATDLPRRILELGLIHILFSTALLSVCTAPALETNSSQLSVVSFIMNVKPCRNT
jgi:hypothetical protein